uniref:Uncharacterized protein n=1 Tax=Rhizophora mucronata TaxID=61149 RepID=A0A2P2QMI8_RHIMU
MGGPTSSGGSGSSSEEEDEEWKAAIESIAATTTFGNKPFGTTSNGAASRSAPDDSEDDEEVHTQKPQKLKHYQIKAQKLLDQILEKTLSMERDPLDASKDGHLVNECGVRLFKNSPAGIVFDHADEIQRPRKRPRILPRQDSNEKSKKFRQKLRSVAVDGVEIIAAARDAAQKSLARFEAKEEAIKAKAKTEEERVAELKRIRGERWLPSISKEIQVR